MEKCVLSAGKPMSIKFLVLGGGYFGFWEGGGKVRFYFYGRGDFSEKHPLALLTSVAFCRLLLLCVLRPVLSRPVLRHGKLKMAFPRNLKL